MEHQGGSAVLGMQRNPFVFVVEDQRTARQCGPVSLAPAWVHEPVHRLPHTASDLVRPALAVRLPYNPT